jgi:hypothetical protein
MRLADTQLWAGETPGYLVHRAEQVHDAGALSHIGRVTVQFNPQFQRLLLHRVALLRGSATVDHTASAEVRFLQRESGLEQGVVSGVVTATMVLPDVRVGDTLELVYTVEGENPIFAGRYAGWAGWDQSHPVALRRVTLVAPPHRRIHWRWIGDRPGPLPEAPVERLHEGLCRLQFEGRAGAGEGLVRARSAPPGARPGAAGARRVREDTRGRHHALRRTRRRRLRAAAPAQRALTTAGTCRRGPPS